MSEVKLFDPLNSILPIIIPDLPADERDLATTIWNQLCDLETQEKNFANALGLFLASRQNGEQKIRFKDREVYVSSWAMIAARDGAMTIYHFGKATEYIRARLRETKILSGMVAHEKIVVAGKLLRESFPRFEAVRHATAHTTDLRRDKTEERKHALKNPVDNVAFKIGFKGALMFGNLINNTFETSFEGELVRYDITFESLQRLSTIKALYLEAFAIQHAE